MTEAISFHAEQMWIDVCCTMGISRCVEMTDDSGNRYPQQADCQKCRQAWFTENTKLCYNTTLSDDMILVVQGNEEDLVEFVLEYVR